MKTNGLILFMRYPEKGVVKTRLAKDIGDNITLALYKQFLIDILRMCEMIDAKIMLAYSISEKMKDERLFFSKQYINFPQEGFDFGQRMFNALCTAFRQGFKKSILIGSDSPDLPGFIIDEAYKALDASDIILGPSPDGGFYLIGFCSDSIDNEVFSNIEWGGPYVLRDTLDNIKRLRMRYHLLPEWDDIDDVHDLKRYYTRHKNSKKGFATMQFLLQNKEILSKWLIPQ